MDDVNGKLGILNRAQAGDHTAITDLFRQCRGDIYYYALQVLESEEGAKKAVRDTLFMMCKEESVPATEADFTPWMLFICHRCCKSYLPAGRQVEMPQPVSVPETDYVAVDATDNGVLPAAARDRLMAGIQVLSVEERAMIVLLYYENLPLKTAAQVMGIHPALAEAYRSQALRALKAAVMTGGVSNALGGCSLKNTLWWIFSAQHKNVKCDALPIYQGLCVALSIVPSEEDLREVQGIHTVKEPVKQQQLKMSLKERMEWWPKPVKIGLAAFLAALVLGGGYLAITLTKDNNTSLETSETSVEDEFLENLEEKFADVSDSETTVKNRAATTAKQTDKYGNRIINGTTRPTTTARVRTKTQPGGGGGGYNGGGNNGNGGGGGNNGNGDGGYYDDNNLYRTTTRRQTRGGGGDNGGGNNGNGGGDNGGSSQRPSPDNGGEGYAAFRPAVPTSNQGSEQTKNLVQGSFKYSLYSNGSAHITGFTGSGSASVPSVIGKYPVTAIDDRAFSGTSVSSVTLPGSVESVGDNAFQNCSSLRSITMTGVVSIGMYAFDGCSSLSSVGVSGSLKRIGSSAFKDCTSLSSFTIPASVNSIEAMAFHGCSALSSITIPAAVTLIEDNVFRNCSSLRTVTIPASVTQIGNGAFYGCNSLQTVYYGGSSEQWAKLPFDESLNRPLTTANVVC